jgi:hypothetical protein
LVARGHESHYFCHFWDEEPEGIQFHKIPYIFKPLRWAKVLAFDRLTQRAIAPGRNAGGFPETAILIEYWRFTTKLAPAANQ